MVRLCGFALPNRRAPRKRIFTEARQAVGLRELLSGEYRFSIRADTQRQQLDRLLLGLAEQVTGRRHQNQE
jgi:hypothetical protein